MRSEYFLQSLGSVGALIWLVADGVGYETTARYGVSLVVLGVLGLLSIIATRLPS